MLYSCVCAWSSWNTKQILKSLHACSQVVSCFSLQSLLGKGGLENKKGSCQVNKSQQVSACRFLSLVKLTCLLIISPIEANQQNIPVSYLLNLQLLQKERKERHGKRFVMDSSRMTMADKSIPNMGTCGVHWMVSGSCLKGLVSLLLHLHVTNCIYHKVLYNIYGEI